MVDNNNTLSQLAELAQQELIPLLKKALCACTERHQLTIDEGSDSFSFGTDAWSFPTRAFKDRFVGYYSDIKVTNKSGCVLKFQEMEIRHHRVGSSTSDNIRTSFPNGAKAACVEVIAEQESFDFIDNDNIYESNVILAYMANPEEGLCAAYLAIPKRIHNNKIIEWGNVVELYRREENTDDLFTQDNGIQHVKPEIISEPVVTMNKKPKASDKTKKKS